MTRTECYIVLNGLRGVGPVRVHKLKNALGSVEAIFSVKHSELARIEGVGSKVAQSIERWEEGFDLGKELKTLKEIGACVVDCEADTYPSLLKEIYDPPLVLYYQGDLEAARRKSIGVVGSRQTSYYGLETARKLSYQMAFAGLTVTSGLARGIDTAAHQAALAAKGRTVAVFGSSLDRVYPSENEALAERIREQQGVLLSEFPFKTPPDRRTFPMRNRIVSGLSVGLLVVEAGERSGALITAKMGLEQGRQVFAVPGRIDNPQAKGCHQLIKDGACLVESVDDILGEFEFLFSENEVKEEQNLPKNLSKEEYKVLEVIEREEVQMDKIIRKCELPSAVVSSTLLRLEMKRLVRQLPGKYFVRTD